MDTTTHHDDHRRITVTNHTAAVRRITNGSLNHWSRNPDYDNSDVIRDRVNWRGNNLRGECGGAITCGQLPRYLMPLVGKADYVIYSYATPIMWHIPEVGWFDPEHRYSVTTSKHQSQVRGAMIRQGIRPITFHEVIAA